MNREVRFRGKRIDNGEWVYGDLENCRIRKCTFIHCYTEDGNYHKQHEVDAETIGQYTGLQDKDGKDIYEGDVLKHNTSTFSGVVTWNSNGYFYIKEKHILFPDEEPSCTPLGEMIVMGDFVVINNIHDNPELLKGGEE